MEGSIGGFEGPYPSLLMRGADEIDCVLEPRLHDGFPGESELALLLAMREASRDKILKVIIETPLLDEHSIRATSRLAMASGVDFVKTCTGKRGDCTDEDARILSMEANRHLVTMGERKGVKISGGIRKTEGRPEDALHNAEGRHIHGKSE